MSLRPFLSARRTGGKFRLSLEPAGHSLPSDRVEQRGASPGQPQAVWACVAIFLALSSPCWTYSARGESGATSSR